MSLIFVFCLVGFVISGRTVTSCEEGESNNEVASKSLGKAGEILDIYDQNFGIKSNTWKNFHESLSILVSSQHTFPEECQPKFSEIENDLRSVEYNHVVSTQIISFWCQESTPKLQTYLRLLNGGHDRAYAESQRQILIDVLKNGVQKLNNALDLLRSCITLLSNAAGNVIVLDNQVESIRRSRTGRLEEQKKNVRDTQWWFFIFPPLGTTVTLINELDTIPRINNKIGDINFNFQRLRNNVKNVESDIRSARDELKREIISLENLECQASVTQKYVQLSYQSKLLIELHTNNLIGKCASYREKHRFLPIVGYLVE